MKEFSIFEVCLWYTAQWKVDFFIWSDNLCLLIGVFSPITLSIICPFPRAGHSNWGSLLHTHNTTIKIRKLTYIYYCHLIFKPQSNLASCPSNTLYIEQRMHCRTSCCLSFSCLFSLEQFLSFSLISMTLTWRFWRLKADIL